MDEPMNAALSTNPSQHFDVKKLSELVSKVQLNGVVSRSDVEPYIEEFPPTVSLDDFDEEPSNRNVDMALESFASFLKLGLAVAVVGALGYLIWYLVNARKKGDKLSDESVAYQNLINALSDLERFNRVSEVNGPAIADGNYAGLNLANALNKLVSEGHQGVLDNMAGNHMLAILYRQDPCLSVAVSSFLTPEAASQGPALERLAKLVPTISTKLAANKQNEVLEELVQIKELVAKLSYGSALGAVFSKKIKAVSLGSGDHVSELGLKVVQEIEQYFEARETDTRGFNEFVTQDIANCVALDKVRGTAFEPGATRVIIQAISTACKNAGATCEKIKKEAGSIQLTAEVESEISETVRLIQNNLKVTEKVMDLIGIEQASLQAYIKFLLGVAKDTGPIVETIVKQLGNGSTTRQAAKLLTEVQQAAKKI